MLELLPYFASGVFVYTGLRQHMFQRNYTVLCEGVYQQKKYNL